MVVVSITSFLFDFTGAFVAVVFVLFEEMRTSSAGFFDFIVVMVVFVVEGRVAGN